LKEQLKSLGLTGQFPDDDMSEDDDLSDSNWTDEESSPPPPPPPPKQSAKQKKDASAAQKLAEETKSKFAELSKQTTIDRPLQLSAPVPAKQEKFASVKNTKLKISPQATWYTIPLATPPTSSIAPNEEGLSRLQSRGKLLLQSESEIYLSSSHISSSDRQFLSTVMTSGTQSDKLSALTLSVSASPLHGQRQLDALLGMAGKKSRNEAVQAVAAIKDLLIGNLLPERKLVYFGKNVGVRVGSSEEELMVWTFEDWLKGWYFKFLQVVEVSSRVVEADVDTFDGSVAFCTESYDFVYFGVTAR
jgi:ribosome biogenesis protein MAK21